MKQLAQRWSRQVIHVWDRGFAGTPWIQAATTAEMRFILRWKKGNYLIDEKGERRKTSDMSRSKRSVDHRLIYDTRHRIQRKTGIVFMPVRLPDLPEQPLWLVISRPGAGRLPWFLLTNESIQSIDQAWRIVFGYTRRWQIETVIRLEKTELGIEGIRLVAWECRQKLMLILAIVHAFLLSLLDPSLKFRRTRLLTTGCHRTGKRGRLCAAPLYRLRLALSALWLAFRPLSLPRLI